VRNPLTKFITVYANWNKRADFEFDFIFKVVYNKLMKICRKCEKEKPFIDFNKRTRSKDGYNAFCKQCNKEYLQQHYKDNKQYYFDKSKNNRDKVMQIVREYKAKPCCDCKIEYPYYVMDFDHRENKEFNISEACKNFGLAKIEKEIEKCDVVCSNCHRERTHKRYIGM
jgi:hypothetical protein